MLAVPRKKTFPREAKEQGDRFATVNRNILRVELRSLLPQLVMPIFGFVPLLVVREIRTPRSVGAGGGRLPPATRWMWKRSHGGTIKAPPDERGGNRYGLPNATAAA
jgi:hypothetical protein